MADGLRLALFGLHRGGSAEPDTLARRARLAEEVGFESFWIGDHVALPFLETPGGDPPGQRRLEAVVALAYMAALTSRVRLAIGVIVLPQRQPVRYTPPTVMTRRPTVMTRHLGGHQAVWRGQERPFSLPRFLPSCTATGTTW
jgi:Luciferase-like monooxygenase